MQDRLTELLADRARTKAAWETERTVEALRAYIYAQGNHNDWVKDQKKREG